MNKQEIIERLQAFDMKQSGASTPANIEIENVIEGNVADLILFRDDSGLVSSSCVMYHDGTMLFLDDWQSWRPENFDEVATTDGWVDENLQPCFTVAGLPRVLIEIPIKWRAI